VCREAAVWPAVPLLLYGARGPLAVRLAAHRFLGSHADRAHALDAVDVPAAGRPVVRVSLPFEPASAHTGREVVCEACRDWDVTPHLGDAELVVSELVTNAVRHAAPPLRLTVSLRGAYLHVAVRDASARLPRQRHSDDTGGRGLSLVDIVTTAWGSTPAGEGKTVWAILRVRTADGRRRKDDLVTNRRD
jgi:hypothetical protein